jgi:hypothetical protein
MSVNTKLWKLPKRYDDSDPNAKILEEDLLKILGIKKPSLYAHLPANRFPREDGYILGIKLREEQSDTVSIPPPPPPDETPVLSIDMSELKEPSEPSNSTLYQLKEDARIANNKVAEMYKTLGQTNPIKKEPFTDWFKGTIWRKNNGTLECVLCPVCSLNTISICSFHAGHILPESKGGMMCLENIIPICSDCNSHMGSRHLYWFAWHYFGKVMWSVY